MRLWGLLLVPLAATAPALDVRVEQSTAHGTLVDPLSMNLTVTLTDRSTGQPPDPAFDLFAFATAGAEKTTTFPCALDRANDPAAPLGRYSCTVIVDHGGSWEFRAVVNKKRSGPKDPVVSVAQGAATIEVSGSAAPVNRPAQGRGIKGRPWEIFVLWVHSAFAAAWFAGVALLLALGVPGARRLVSGRGLHRLEERFDLLLKGTAAAAALTVGSGTYLLLQQTAYKTPFSPSAVHGVFSLPYGRPYFLALGTKLALYAVMLAATVPVVREAGRQLRVASAPAPATEHRPGRDPWASAPTPSGRTLVADMPVIAPSRVPSPESRSGPVAARVGAVVIGAGGLGLWVCVTLLKYFHELVEASRLR